MAVEIFGTCASARIGPQVSETGVLVCGPSDTMSEGQSVCRSPGAYGCALRSASPTPSCFYQGRRRWNFIYSVNLLPKEKGEGRKFVVVVQHKGGRTNMACRRQ